MTYRPNREEALDQLAMLDALRTFDSIVTAFSCQPRFRNTHAGRWLKKLQERIDSELWDVTSNLSCQHPDTDVISSLTALYAPYLNRDETLKIRDVLRDAYERDQAAYLQYQVGVWPDFPEAVEPSSDVSASPVPVIPTALCRSAAA